MISCSLRFKQFLPIFLLFRFFQVTFIHFLFIYLNVATAKTTGVELGLERVTRNNFENTDCEMHVGHFTVHFQHFGLLKRGRGVGGSNPLNPPSGFSPALTVLFYFTVKIRRGNNSTVIFISILQTVHVKSLRKLILIVGNKPPPS